MPHSKAPSVRHDDPEMRGPRSRNDDGQLRQKRGDTHIKTIEQQYHVDFHRRGDTHLDTLRKEYGVDSIQELIDKAAK